MKIVEPFPDTNRTFAMFSDIAKLYDRNEVFVITLPSGQEVICFHYDGTAIPEVALYELAHNKGMLICCCHPERLPSWLRKRHLFPNGRGKCSLFIPTERGEKPEMVFECSK